MYSHKWSEFISNSGSLILGYTAAPLFPIFLIEAKILVSGNKKNIYFSFYYKNVNLTNKHTYLAFVFRCARSCYLRVPRIIFWFLCITSFHHNYWSLYTFKKKTYNNKIDQNIVKCNLPKLWQKRLMLLKMSSLTIWLSQIIWKKWRYLLFSDYRLMCELMQWPQINLYAKNRNSFLHKFIPNNIFFYNVMFFF